MEHRTVTISEKSEKKIAPLECLRGTAALIVFFWHFLIAFLPNRSGFFNEFPPEKGLIGGLLFIPFNGLAAVSFFFVLSGFVLTFRFFQTEDHFIVVSGILKRWPRLLGPVTLSVLFSWLCFASGLYFYSEAATLTGSPYLRDFAFAKLPSSFTPSLGGALAQGMFTTFFKGDGFYNTNLWTMRPELLGSFLAFSLAPTFAILKNRYVITSLSILIILVLHFIDPIYTGFVVGVLIAYAYAHHDIRFPWPIVIGMLTVALFLFGFIYPRDLYLFTADLPFMSIESLRTYMHIISAALMILAVLGFQPLYDSLTGRWARLLGELSFPIYLTQTIVICSFSSWFFIKFSPVFSHPILVGMDFVVTLFIILFLSLFLYRFDKLWVILVNRAARCFIKRPECILFPSRRPADIA